MTDIYFALAVASNNVNSTNPKFTTTSQSFRAVVGDTITQGTTFYFGSEDHPFYQQEK